jgi:hypothetical protein
MTMDSINKKACFHGNYETNLKFRKNYYKIQINKDKFDDEKTFQRTIKRKKPKIRFKSRQEKPGK